MLGEETTGLEHLVAADADPDAKAKDVAQAIVDLLIVEEATVNDTLTALSIVLCFTVMQFKDPMAELEDVYDEVRLNITGEFGEAAAAEVGPQAVEATG